MIANCHARWHFGNLGFSVTTVCYLNCRGSAPIFWRVSQSQTATTPNAAQFRLANQGVFYANLSKSRSVTG